MSDEVVTTYWMGGLTFARHSSHAGYATKERLAPSALADISICLLALRSGLVLVGLGDSREAAERACQAQRKGLLSQDAPGPDTPPQRQGNTEEQDHG